MTSEAQYLTALQKANAVREARSKVKREIRNGELKLSDAMRMPECQQMLVAQLLESQRRWGPVKVAAVLAHEQISQARVVADLSERQKSVLSSVQYVRKGWPYPPLVRVAGKRAAA